MPSFLNSLVGAQADEFLLINRQTNSVVATHLITAFDSKSRRTGLLDHEELKAGVAMLIAPSNAIHTFFMRFPIDVAFVARNGRVVKIREGMPPWRIAAAWRAYAVVEVAAGALAQSSTKVSDVLEVRRTVDTSSHSKRVAQA